MLVSKAQHLIDMIEESYSATFSVPNFVKLILATKRQAIGHKIAGLLSSSDAEEEEVEALMADYKKLLAVAESEDESNVIYMMTVEDAINKVFDTSGRIYLAPKALNDATGVPCRVMPSSYSLGLRWVKRRLAARLWRVCLE